MRLLNAGIEILNANQISSGKWSITAKIYDTTGLFSATDVKIDYNIFAYGVNPDTCDTYLCKYTVMEKLATNKADILSCIIGWAENDSEYCDPQPDKGIIGQNIQGGMTAISNADNGITSYMIETARNIDLANGNFDNYTSDKRCNIAIDNNIILNKKYTLQDTPRINSDVVILNGIILTNQKDYVLNNNVLSFNTDVDLNIDDTLVVLYKS